MRKHRTCRSHLDLWLADVLDIRGLPIPYGAPNATPHVEWLVRTLREEALDHFIFLSVGHASTRDEYHGPQDASLFAPFVRRVLSEFVSHYNGGRPSL